ncbi:MAG: flavin reductase [Bacillota bacterium]|nr:flavin reductase [Bacillota bacterium]
MQAAKKITEDLTWVGADDRRLAMFEGVYSVPGGVSYNSYLLNDEKTVLFDTVDKAVSKLFFENLNYALNGKSLDYLVVHHMEPDHSAAMTELILRYPDVKIICSAKILTMIKQFFDFDIEARAVIVKEGDTFSAGGHTLTFFMAPMVHWPEVMVSYDSKDKLIFSADAFGSFGAVNGAIFSDQVDFNTDYMGEARRYYTNIVGKYGAQVQALLKKLAGLEINMICPLHGFVWRTGLNDYIEKYRLWSSYLPEETGVVIAYASVYGNTENAANALACRIFDSGIKTVMFDVSVTPASEIIAACFRYSHLVFASTTYNAGIFVTMEALLHDLAAHNIQNRTVAFIENGSWAPTSKNLMSEIFKPLKNITVLEETLSIKSGLKPENEAALNALAESVIASSKLSAKDSGAQSGSIDPKAMFKISYGLYVLTARDTKDNGCIINTVNQVADNPKRIAIAVNKANYTHDMIVKTGIFNVSVLKEETPFNVFKHFGFTSGRNEDKFKDEKVQRSQNGLAYITENTNSFISGKVISMTDLGSHTLFIAEVTESEVLSDKQSITYDYYFRHVKPKPEIKTEVKKGFVCKICGYVYEGEVLPPDFICPICKHGAEDFEPIS